MAMPRRGDSSCTRIELTRTQLRDAAQTWTRLVRGFPRALPRLVDDLDRWSEGVPQVLKWLKGAIHDGKPLPESPMAVDHAFPPAIAEQSAAIATRCPSLRPLLNALSWSHYLSPDGLSAALPWIESNARAIRTILDAQSETDGLVTVLRLCELARRDGARRVSAILRFAGNPRAWTVDTRTDPDPDLRTVLAIRAGRWNAVPSRGKLGEDLAKFTDWLIRQEQRTRRCALDLLDLTLPDGLLGDWEAWWAQVNRLMQQAHELRSTVAHENEELERGIRVVVEAYEAHEKRAPPEIDIELLLYWIRGATTLGNRGFCKEARKAVQCLPASADRQLLRADFLGHCFAAERESENGHLIVPFMREFREYSSRLRRDAPQRYDVWLNIVSHWPSYHTHHILDHVPERSLWPAVFEALTAISFARLYRDAWPIVHLVALTYNAERATRRFIELAKAGPGNFDIDHDLLRCAWSLDRRPARFAKIATALSAHHGDQQETAELVTAVETCLRDAGWAGVVAGLVEDGEAKLICDVGRRLAFTRELQGEVDLPALPTVDEMPEWARRYPETLRPVLGTLSGVTGDAEQIADRLLGKDCPDPESLRREISAIERRLCEHPDDPRLPGRLRNLRFRTESAQAISPVRLGRLKGKLERAVRRNLVAALQARLEVVLGARFRQQLEVDALPDWMFEPQQLRVLAPMLRLSRAFRALGLRLFRRRLGPPPWNLAEDRGRVR